MKKTSTCVATIVTTALLGMLALIVPAPAEAATPVPGSDCGCPTATGAYKTPAAPVEPEIEPDGSSAASAPKYRVETLGSWPDVTLKVRRLADSTVVLTVPSAPTNWGFSPDQNRFVTYGISNTVFSVALYDLTAASTSQPMWTGSTLSSESRVAFSPHGRYFAFTALNGIAGQVTHQFVDTTTGSEYDVQYGFYVPPGGTTKPFGEAGFGFSPEAGDHALFVSVVTGQQSVQNSLFDLRAKKQTWSSTFDGSSGFWKFSPCGDMLGLVAQQAQTGEHVTLVHVTDGQLVADQTYPFPISTIGFTATSTQHQVVVDGVAHYLANNTAGAVCTDTTAPTWPANAALTASNVAKSSLTLTWPAASDDKAVTTYKIYKGSTLLGTTGVSNRTYNVTGLTQGTSYTFTVQAADAAGNTTTDGPSATVRTAADAPTWPAGSSVVASDVTETGGLLRWSAASGTVSSYQVLRDGALVGTVPGTARTYAATGLSSGTSYLFKVEAVGPTGAVSTTGPAVRVRTPGYTRLDTDAITGTVWWDDDGDGERDAGEDGVDGTPSAYVYVGLDAYRMIDGTTAKNAGGAHMAADGTYSFDDLPDGDYLVALDFGSLGQTFPGDNQPQRISVVDGHGVGNVDFGMKLASTIPTQGSGDGAITATVSGAEGAEVSCYYVSLGSGCGNGGLSGLTSGTYEISAVPGPHQWQSAPVLDGEPLKHVLVVGGNGGGGAASFTVEQGRSAISGQVYDDADGDGVQDAGEGPLTDPDSIAVCIERIPAGDPECTSTQGGYSFADLRPGDYRLTVGEDDGWHQTAPAGDPVQVHLETNGDTVTAPDLGVHNPRGTVHGLVWDDRDADGHYDDGEAGLPGITVCVQKVGYDGWDCLETDAEGRYATGLLRAADYSVWIPVYSTDRTQTFPGDGKGHDVTVGDGGTEAADFGLNDGTVVPEETAPDAPTALEAVAGVEQVTLSWTAPVDDGGSPVTGYVVQRSLDGVAWSGDQQVDGTSVEVTGLAAGIPVHFRVAAVNAVGQGDWSDGAAATPAPRVVAPGAPRDLSATAGIEKVTLSWAEPADDGGAAVTGYVVQKSLDGRLWTPAGTTAGTPAGTTLEVTGLKAGTPVRFRVAAVNEAGTGAFAAEAVATPQATPKPPVTVPGAPTGLAAAVSKNHRTVTLTWKAPADSGAPITDYVVQRTLFPSLGWVTVTDGVSAGTAATITSPLPGLRFGYRVAARNSAGLGAWSAVVYAG
ncbi:MAG: fibronectin type III domain-containing protein [Nocardioidaceae bacterium]|nr:fibronectin type III domain-containing protein [Nocardioidaceae bacterium]